MSTEQTRMQGDSIVIGCAWFHGHRWDKAKANASLPPTRRVAAALGNHCAGAPSQLCRPKHPIRRLSMTSALPFDDFRTLMQNLPDGDEAAANRVRTLFVKAEKPAG